MVQTLQDNNAPERLNHCDSTTTSAACPDSKTSLTPGCSSDGNCGRQVEIGQVQTRPGVPSTSGHEPLMVSPSTDIPSCNALDNNPDDPIISDETTNIYVPNNNLNVYNLIFNKEPLPTVDTVRSLNSKKTSSNLYDLAFVETGFTATTDSKPVYFTALLDSGCNQNLISLSLLQALPDFDKLKISMAPKTKIKCADNSETTQVHGKTTLLISLHTTCGKRLVYSTDFFVTSGLLFDCFLGSPFFHSPQISHITKSSIFFFKQDIFSPSSSSHSSFNPSCYVVPKIFDANANASSKSKHIVPPKSASKIKVNCALPNFSQNNFVYLEPNVSPTFTSKFPSLLIPPPNFSSGK